MNSLNHLCNYLYNFELSGKYSNKDFLVTVSLLILTASGLLILLINTYINTNKNKLSLRLNYNLWKFLSDDNKIVIYKDKILYWRKLLLGGVMIASLVMSILVRVMEAKSAILISIALVLVYTVFLLFYWYYYIVFNIEKPITNDSIDKNDTSAWSIRRRDRDSFQDQRLPVTIVTGFLGSGKTTLVKNILKNTIGMKVLVIENEVGAEGIDHELLMQHQAPEEIILMNNGCICCTVRQDLLKTFHRLLIHEGFAALDWVIIETTGLADPAPLIQSLYMDAKCQASMRLDSVLTVVDSKHLPLHLHSDKRQAPRKVSQPESALRLVIPGGQAGSNSTDKNPTDDVSEAVLQVSYADIILLNKVDLISETESLSLTEEVRTLNKEAKIFTCQNSQVPIEEILNVRAFDSTRNKAILNADNNYGVKGFIQCDANGKIIRKPIQLNIKTGEQFDLSTSKHNSSSRQKRRGAVSTVTIVHSTGPLDLEKFNRWVAELLRTRGEEIFRLKGILWMRGYDQQFVAQGVHMVFDGQLGPPWGGNDRYSKVVVIGLNLNQSELEKSFLKCSE